MTSVPCCRSGIVASWIGNCRSNPSALIASNISGLKPSFSKLLIDFFSLSSRSRVQDEDRRLVPSFTYRRNEISVVSLDFGDFGQLQQEEEHAVNRCK